MAIIKAIYRYPVKGLGAELLEECKVLDYGIQYDRNWMIVDDTGTFVTQRERPNLTQFDSFISNEHLSIRDNTNGDIMRIPIDLKGPDEIKTSVWGSDITAHSTDNIMDAWLSSRIGGQLRLVTVGQAFKRHKEVDSTLIPVRFADGYPILILSQASVDHLNEKLENPIKADRFRANILIDDCPPHGEDIAKSFQTTNITFRMVKQCRRCTVVNTDQQTGEVHKEPLRTLATYRKIDSHVMFGVNVYPESEGTINRGEKVLLDL
jgi:uncharacterized protein YcbX